MGIIVDVDKLYLRLTKTYPKINARPNENLNIQTNTARILRKCWFDVERYYTVLDIAIAVGLKDRQVYRWADKYCWPRRSKIKKETRLKKVI